MKVKKKDLPKVFGDSIVKDQVNGKCSRATEKDIDIPVSTIGSIKIRWYHK